MEQLVRSGAIDDLRRVQPMHRADRLAQPGRGGVGIAGKIGGRRDKRGPRGGASAQRIFIGRQLDQRAAIVGGGFTGDIGRNAQDPVLGSGICHGIAL